MSGGSKASRPRPAPPPPTPPMKSDKERDRAALQIQKDSSYRMSMFGASQQPVGKKSILGG